MPRRTPHAPELIAHRGMPRVQPENSLPGFELAIQSGADGLELDVHGTRDGAVVVHHDPVVRSPDGVAAEIATSSLTELRSLCGEPGALPTLEEVLELAAGGPRVYIEVKAPGIEIAVVALIHRRADACAVHSFDHRIVHRVRTLDPAIRCGVLMSSYLMDPVAPLRDTGAADLWQHWSMIDGALVAAAHAVGARVIAWTVNEPSVASDLAGLGVDGLCSDDIRVIVAR